MKPKIPKQKAMISIIVPIYNTAQFLNKCIDSILNQSLKQFELILVDDFSSDNSGEIIRNYQKIDSRVTCVFHQENKGLFAARMTGVENSSGEYIAFVDSDDFVSIDWFRELLNQAQQEDADITIGNTINVSEDEKRYIYNVYQSLTRSHRKLENEEIITAFFEQEGSCFLWHTVWNKLYSRRLWQSCKSHFASITEHTVMMEDMAFSTALFFHAKKLVFVDHDGYFYYRHKCASTSVNASKSRYLKHLGDIDRVFCFIESFLKETGILEKFQGKFTCLKERYFRIWSSNLTAVGLDKDFECLTIILKTFDKQALEPTRGDDFYFYSLTSGWDDKLEKLKLSIADPFVEVVSFDIFDTMLLRPFLEPSDLFCLMDSYYNELCPSGIPLAFKTMRCCSEEACRKEMLHNNPSFQDVTLDEIYEYMQKIYSLNEEVKCKLMQKEMDLEFRFCQKRKTAASLFEMAKALNKKIILISDMYLEQTFIEKLLAKNGYYGYDNIFVSSKIRLLKVTGDLYRYALKKLKMNNYNKVLHIGDNWNSDVIIPRQLKMKAAFMAKPKEVLFNEISDINTGECASPFVKPASGAVNYKNGINSFGIRCMLAVVANEMFDNPYRNFYEKSNYNADGYFMGFYALGMHIFGLAKWLIEDAIKGELKTLHFLARDGFLVKNVYDILSEVYQNAAKSSYLHINRRSILPYSISNPTKLYSIIEAVNYKNHTPRDLISIFEDIFKPQNELSEKEYLKKGISLDKKITDINELSCIIQAMISISYYKEKQENRSKMMTEFLQKRLKNDDGVFDIGYSGRVFCAIKRLAKLSINGYYLHSAGDLTTKISDIKCFYDFTPTISGVVREYFISDFNPPCIGYKVEVGELNPVFDGNKPSYQESYGIGEMFKGATDFANRMVCIFGDDIKDFRLRPQEVSAPFEFFLNSATEFDRYLFHITKLEDEVYDGYNSKSLFDIWSWNIAQYVKFDEPKTQPKPTLNCLAELYEHGLFVSFYNSVNRLFPKSSRRREWLKRIVGLFLKT